MLHRILSCIRTNSIGATQLSRLTHIPYRRSDKQRARL